MPRSYVLMTALPPTKGHLKLIEFAALLGDSAEVIVCTQPDEPWAFERLTALRVAGSKLKGNINFHHIHKTLPQEPNEPVEFWDMWADFLGMFGIQPGDYIVASEQYGAKLAEITGGIFMPYDIDRALLPTKATNVREHPYAHFSMILPEFQRHLRRTITVFGAESTGKTTLSRDLAKRLMSPWLFEYARPYLEHTSPDITRKSMTAIWKGQLALQRQAFESTVDAPFIVQDTDLFSTVGYWDHWAGGVLANRAPQQLVQNAKQFRSDLYIVTQSNIPFEPDPLRYGGDKRELPDGYWIDLLDREGANYVVLGAEGHAERLSEATGAAMDLFNDQGRRLAYQRLGKEYAPAT
jgi:HTH-type transcriptional repressor of NAD biosynthesis genes